MLFVLVIELAYVIKTAVFSDHWSLNNDDECKVFLETIKLAIGKNVDPPKQFSDLSKKIEKFEIIDNKLEDIKKYIINKI